MEIWVQENQFLMLIQKTPKDWEDITPDSSMDEQRKYVYKLTSVKSKKVFWESIYDRDLVHYFFV